MLIKTKRVREGGAEKEELSDFFRNSKLGKRRRWPSALITYCAGAQLVTAEDSGPITLTRLTRAIQSANFRATDCVRAALLRARATRDQSIYTHAARRASPSGISMENSWTDSASPSSPRRKFDSACDYIIIWGDRRPLTSISGQ